MLNQRLRELRESGLVSQDAALGYRLSERGTELGAVLAPLIRWSDAWARGAARTPGAARRGGASKSKG